jgi:hypothetical protein
MQPIETRKMTTQNKGISRDVDENKGAAWANLGITRDVEQN